jgi:hypothetical protein
MIAWSAFEVSRFSLTWDFTGFYHTWYLIGHGVLNPGPGWWKAQAIFIMWPLGLLSALFPHPLTLMIIQDGAMVLAEAVAYSWLLDIVRSHRSLPAKETAAFGLAILVLNPWTYWAISGDYHSEPVGLLFLILASRAFYDRRWTAWLWAAITLTCGLVPATYILGVAIGLFLTRGRRRAAVLLGLMTCIWLYVMLKIGTGSALLGQGSTAVARQTANPLSSVTHQIHVVADNFSALWPDMLALIAPTLFIGAFTTETIGIVAVVLGTSMTAGYGGLAQFYQNVPIYVFMPVGTVIAVGAIANRFGIRAARCTMVLVLASAIGWTAVWVGALKPHYIRVSGVQASALRSAERLIPPSAEALVSQGESGIFAGRLNIESLATPPPFEYPLYGSDVWFLITPYAGVELDSVQTSTSAIQNLEADSHARLMFERNGVWLFELHPPKGTHIWRLDRNYSKISAALFETHGLRNLEGGPAHWSMTSNGHPGLVVYGDYWLERIGAYETSVTVNSRGPFKVTLRNESASTVLKQEQLPRTHGYQTVTLSGSITPADPAASASPFSGVGPFAIRPIPADPGNNLEVTVTSLSDARVTVRSIAVRKTATRSQ